MSVSHPHHNPLNPTPPNEPPPIKNMSRRNFRRRKSSRQSLDSDINRVQSRPTSSALSRYSVLPDINGERPFTPYNLSSEPDANSLHIALKLLNGERIQRRFNRNDKLLELLKFASNYSNEDFCNYELFNPHNRSILRDMELSLHDVDLADKTTLFIQIPD
ncbi:DgyrCDS8460 [Dimorphilus gyrociliatus]|uniref:DgyrCDS8460 n=1 Tax=Dimorphilus gyrociliatus TaxID=2664684 RepID=A0A7I8VVX5_9ANNE|nr:DgyrCDS8460 [Dimorphilus gyrociliatus]